MRLWYFYHYIILLQNNNNKSNAKVSHAKSTCEHFPLFCDVLIQEIFSVLLCSFPLPSSGFSSVFISLALGIRLTSIYMLRCWGDATSWDFFTALLVHSFSLFPPLSFLYLFEHLYLGVNLFYILPITRAYRFSIFFWRVKCD